MQHAQEELASASSEVQALRDKIKSQEEELQSAKSDLEGKVNDVSLLQQRIQTLQVEVDSIHQSDQEKAQGLSDALSKKDAELASLTEQVSQKSKEADAMVRLSLGCCYVLCSSFCSLQLFYVSEIIFLQ